METLSASKLHELGQTPAQLPAYDRRHITAGIAHVGVGNFHRVHQAVYVDRCLHLNDQAQWGILGIGLGVSKKAKEKADAFKQQDGLFTVTEYAPDGSVDSRVIAAMIEYLHAADGVDAIIDALARPTIRIISLTITEGGYNLSEQTGEFQLAEIAVKEDLADPQNPMTAFGVVAQAMARRRERGLSGVTILSCDNLRSNGDVARKAFISYARAVDGELAAWMESNMTFPNSMVDRIAPMVGANERHKANQHNKIDDKIPAIAEEYIQWVVEDDFIAGRPDFGAVGVELRNDVAAFEAVKGRMLNACHMMMSYPALMLGHREVHVAMADQEIKDFLSQFLSEDVTPLVTAPSGVSLDAYKKAIIQRFSNPAVGDQILRIAHDGFAKLPVFLSRTTQELVKSGGDISRLAFHLACFRAYFSGKDDLGNSFEVAEPALTSKDDELINSNDPVDFLRITPIEPLQLWKDPQFSSTFSQMVDQIGLEGTTKTLSRLLKQKISAQESQN